VRKFDTVIPMLMLAVIGAMLLLAGPKAVRTYTLAEQSARVMVARQELADDDILRRIDRAVAAIADAVSPSVVHIEVSEGRRSLTGSSGAGWVFDGDGHVVTNAHVVRGSQRISVEFADGVVTGARLVGSDVYTDIAVLRVERDGSELIPARRSEMRLPRVGERAFAFGSPFGFKFSMSEGVVSGLGRRAPGSSIPGGYTNYIQTDAAVNPGNSGGPLVNSDGHVIGMNVAIATSRTTGASPEEAGGDSAGISFAIPLGTIEPIVDQLIRYGSVSRGYLGINFEGDGPARVTLDDGMVLTGVRVSGTEPGGPSERAGLQRGDVIVQIEGSPIVTTESLSALVSSGRAGEDVAVRVWRDGKLIDMSVTLAPIRNEVLAQRLAEPTQLRLGAMLGRAEQGGVVVLQIWNELPAAKSGLGVGDRLVSINGRPAREWHEFYVMAADAGLLTGQSVRMGVVTRAGEEREIQITLYP
jgi:S1-C subfamily serine protease